MEQNEGKLIIDNEYKQARQAIRSGIQILLKRIAYGG